MKNKFDYFNSNPTDKLKKKAELSIECEGLWREAKEKSNFNIVKKKFFCQTCEINKRRIRNFISN